jgi:hypothetical protein
MHQLVRNAVGDGLAEVVQVRSTGGAVLKTLATCSNLDKSAGYV